MDDDGFSIIIKTRLRTYKIHQENLKETIELLCRYLSLPLAELSVSFVSAAKIKDLNSTYLGKNKSTDVLSFPQNEWRQSYDPEQKQELKTLIKGMVLQPLVLGDIIICPELARRNALQIGQSLQREITFLILHGLLHLLGHDHEKAQDEAKMLKIQRRIMKKYLLRPRHKHFITRGTSHVH